MASAVLASLFLTATATSAPLASLWQGADQKLIALGQEFQRVFRGGGQGTRINAVEFSGSAVIAGQWTTNSDPVLEIHVPDDGRYFWRAVVYDRFDGHGWSWSPPTETQIAAGAGVLGESADNPLDLAGRREVTFDGRELDFNPRAMFAPDTPTKVDVQTTLTTVGTGAQNYFGGLTSDARAYQITSVVPIDGNADPVKGLTANKLKVAGTDYPEAIKQLYLGVEPNVGGPRTDALLAAILARHPEAKDDPYDLARSITTYLTTEGGFIYDDNVLDIDCGRGSAVECFALSKHGYCEHYASTMAILLRMQGVPARVAEGFLPSAPVNGVETILKSASHAWVEVYFPGYGWVTFDPTGGGIGQDRPLPQGPRVTAAPATPRASCGREQRRRQPASQWRAAEQPQQRPRRHDQGRRAGQRAADRHRPAPGDRHGRPRVHRLAAWAAGRLRARCGLAWGRRAGSPVRLRTATQPDRVRVQQRAGRDPAQCPAGSPDRRPGQGRGGLRPAASSATTACGPARRPAAAAGRPAPAGPPPPRATRAQGPPALID